MAVAISGTGCARSGKLASFLGNVLAPRQDCGRPNAKPFRRLMNRTPEFGKDDAQLVGVSAGNDLGAEFPDSIIEAARALGHGKANSFPDERRLPLITQRHPRFDTVSTLQPEPNRANTPVRRFNIALRRVCDIELPNCANNSAHDNLNLSGAAL